MAKKEAAEGQTNTQSYLDRMFAVGAHFGYSRSRRHPSTTKYIYGSKDTVEIIDLEKTAALLEDAKAFVKSLASSGKLVLFVAGKEEARQSILAGAEQLSMPYVAGRWIGGTLTNISEIRKRLERLELLRTQREKGELSKYTKKERLLIDREIIALEGRFGGLLPLREGFPSALFIVDPRHDHIAATEARDLGIPTIALGSTDCDMSEITYPILGNDATRASIALFVHEIVKAYQDGKMTKAETPAAAPTE
jgi:small subunit ribosomal protein S2